MIIKNRLELNMCKVDGCKNPVKTLSLCSKHYMKLYRYGDENHKGNMCGDELSKKLKNVSINEHGCWEWLKGLNSNGYGTIYHNGKKQYVHRLSYSLHVRTLRANEIILHSCDNPKCINPDHLISGTQQDNINDAKNKGRMARGERISKILTSEQVAEIRKMKAEGQKRGHVAMCFGLKKSTLDAIWSGRNWKENK
jgi:hypothetical protein